MKLKGVGPFCVTALKSEISFSLSLFLTLHSCGPAHLAASAKAAQDFAASQSGEVEFFVSQFQER